MLVGGEDGCIERVVGHLRWVGWVMQKVRKPYVHDVVYALSQVIIEILVTGGGDTKEWGTGEVVSSHSSSWLTVNSRSSVKH